MTSRKIIMVAILREAKIKWIKPTKQQKQTLSAGDPAKPTKHKWNFEYEFKLNEFREEKRDRKKYNNRKKKKNEANEHNKLRGIFIAIYENPCATP